jgi:hypothetical protein
LVEVIMVNARRIRSLIVAALAVLGLGINGPAPAFASTLTVTSLGCETTLRGFFCDAEVSGGTGIYTYAWGVPYYARSDYASSSMISVYCAPGGSKTVTFTVTDSGNATASRSVYVYCSGSTP